MTVIENPRPPAQRVDRRSLRILARSLARELCADGLDAHQLLALASELLTGPRAAAVVGPYGDADELPDEVREMVSP